MCSGVGACRKNGGGTMCPSYMVTRDEKDTRPGAGPTPCGLVMSARSPPTASRADALDESLDLCLQCKACKTECPSNVDMAKLKAEYLHQKYKTRPGPDRFPADGPHPPYSEPGRLGDRAPGQLRPCGARPSGGFWRRWPGSTVGGSCRASNFDNLRRWFRRHTPDPRAGSRGTGRPDGRLLHHVQQPAGSADRRGPGPGGGPVTGSSWRAWSPAAAGRRSRRGC